jgi:predicted ATPase
MKESIKIENLGPLKDVYIDEIKPFTFLIGESGSGKSTLMKCISLFRYIYKMENIRSYLKLSKISKNLFRFRIEKHFKNSGLDEFINNNSVIIYSVEFDNGEKVEIKFANKKLYKPNTISQTNLTFSKISFITENRNIIPLWASNTASLAGAYLGFYFHEVYKDFELASDEIKTVDLKHVGLKLNVKKSGKGKDFRIASSSSNEFEIDFKNSSSGTQTSVPITLISKYFSRYFNFQDAFNRSVFSYLSSVDNLTDFRAVKNVNSLKKKIYIHIEEPELSLFPDAQFLLMEELVKDCFIENSNDINLIISTHSPYIINQLNLFINRFDKNIDKPRYDYNKLSVYQVINGELKDLIVKNERLVNTNPLSETINSIYDEYNNLM